MVGLLELYLEGTTLKINSDLMENISLFLANAISWNTLMEKVQAHISLI